MARPYSMDLRQRAMDRLAAGKTSYEAVAAPKVAVLSVIEWAQRQRATGSAAPGQMGGHRRPKITGADRDCGLAEVERMPHVTITALSAGLKARGLTVHPASVGRFLHREGKSLKKSVLAAEQARPKLARNRERWKRHQGRIDPRHLAFLDETWVKTNMAPLRGWGDRSQRLVAQIPHGHWTTMTFIAPLRCDRIEAPWVLNGPINGEAFKTSVEAELVRTLRLGDIVVLDNLGSHKSREVRALVRKVGAKLLFLPPYSPNLNPIEQLFSKLKHAMCKAMGRTLEAVHEALADILETIEPIECRNYLANAGYRST